MKTFASLVVRHKYWLYGTSLDHHWLNSICLHNNQSTVDTSISTHTIHYTYTSTSTYQHRTQFLSITQKLVSTLFHLCI